MLVFIWHLLIKRGYGDNYVVITLVFALPVFLDF
jgi:hypothetical protein